MLVNKPRAGHQGNHPGANPQRRGWWWGGRAPTPSPGTGSARRSVCCERREFRGGSRVHCLLQAPASEAAARRCEARGWGGCHRPLPGPEPGLAVLPLDLGRPPPPAASPPRRKLRAQLIESKAGGPGPARGGRPPPLPRAPFPALGGISSAGLRNEPLINEARPPPPRRAPPRPGPPAGGGGGGDGGKRGPGRKGGGVGTRGPPSPRPAPIGRARRPSGGAAPMRAAGRGGRAVCACVTASHMLFCSS